MGMYHLPTFARRNISRSVRARFYGADSLASKSLSVFYRANATCLDKERYVFAAEHLSHAQIQPYVHDSIVKIIYRGKLYKFRLFFKHHKRLPPNQIVQRLANVTMDGDVLVVACGDRASVRNFRGKVEVRAADKAVQKFAEHIQPFRTKRKFPASVSFRD